jgi:hypothetical protein
MLKKIDQARSASNTHADNTSAALRTVIRAVTIGLKAVEIFAALVEIREWLDCHQYEPVRFKYDQDEDDVILSVDFKTDVAASAFAKRF